MEGGGGGRGVMGGGGGGGGSGAAEGVSVKWRTLWLLMRFPPCRSSDR